MSLSLMPRPHPPFPCPRSLPVCRSLLCFFEPPPAVKVTHAASMSVPDPHFTHSRAFLVSDDGASRCEPSALVRPDLSTNGQIILPSRGADQDPRWWVTGRMDPNGRELFVCHREDVELSAIDMAFQISFGAFS